MIYQYFTYTQLPTCKTVTITELRLKCSGFFAHKCAKLISVNLNTN